MQSIFGRNAAVIECAFWARKRNGKHQRHFGQVNSPCNRSMILLRISTRIVLEQRAFRIEEQLHLAGLTVAVLADVDVCDARIAAVLFVQFFAVEHQHDMRILLDRT